MASRFDQGLQLQAMNASHMTPTNVYNWYMTPMQREQAAIMAHISKRPDVLMPETVRLQKKLHSSDDII